MSKLDEAIDKLSYGFSLSSGHKVSGNREALKEAILLIIECTKEQPDKKLIPFEQHQRGTTNFSTFPKEVQTGVACPQCEKEIVFVDDGTRLTSIPPQIVAECECGWRNYMNWR